MTIIAPALREYDAARRNQMFSPAAWHPDREETLSRHIRHGIEVSQKLRPLMDIRYGTGPRQTMDIFAGPAKHAPLCVAVHGGFWRASDKRAFLFLAEKFAQHGVGYFVANFDMCPAISVEGIVGQIKDAVSWIRCHAQTYNCDPARIFLFGHATGAHLAASLLSGDWSGNPDCDPGMLKGTLLISGLYDLRQIPLLPVNETLKLTADEAVRCSPALNPFGQKTPLILSAAINETPEFIAQTQDMAVATVRAGIATNFRLLEGCGHFDILDRLLDRNNALFDDFMSLICRDG